MSHTCTPAWTTYLGALLLPLALGACSSAAYVPLDPSARHERVGALGFWYAYDTAGVDSDAPALSYLLQQKCRVRKLGPTQGAFFAQSSGYADRAVRSPAFATIIAAKQRWELTRDSGAQIMERLRWAGVEINLYTYDRDAEHPCHADEVIDGKTNAFTPMVGDRDVNLSFLYEPYVLQTMQRGDRRELARTLVHEALHAMGYSHQGLAAGSERYNNAVPTYVACVVEHWGGKARQDWIKANCDKADDARSPLP